MMHEGLAMPWRTISAGKKRSFSSHNEMESLTGEKTLKLEILVDQGRNRLENIHCLGGPG